MIDLKCSMSAEQWAASRNYGLHSVKLKRLEEFKTFNKWVDKLAPNYEGRLNYYEFHQADENYLTYSEGCPVFNFFKVVPGRHFTHDFSLEHLSDNYPIRSDIETIIERNVLKKWDDSFTSHPTFNEDDYILYLTQHLWSRPQFNVFKQVVDYCIKNHEILLIKEHIIPPEGVMYDKAIDYIKRICAVHDNIHFIDKSYSTFPLLSKAKAVWAVNSSVGLAAIVAGKKYSYFSKNVDFAFHIAAHHATSVEEAARYNFSYETFLSKFSWYYDKMIVDVKDENHFYKLDEKFSRFYSDQVSAVDYFR